jgi:sigma-B regulation protein RsbU (phosphoserine phosphatase)
LAGNELAVWVGDVSGQGIGAAILMSEIQAFLRGLTDSGSGERAGVVEALNRVVCEVAPDNIFATLFYAHIDPRRSEVRYVSAGHEPPLLWRKRTGRAHRLDITGTVLGLTGRTVYKERTIGVEAGDVLVAFTDGLTEAADAQGRAWGENGILSVLRRSKDARSSVLVGEILESAARFTDPVAPAQDRTAVVVRFTAATGLMLQEEEAAELAFAAA